MISTKNLKPYTNNIPTDKKQDAEPDNLCKIPWAAEQQQSMPPVSKNKSAQRDANKKEIKPVVHNWYGTSNAGILSTDEL
ncbi:MAG: hypothetical protein NVS1B7_0990 [Candidatus Saccharimonadales bacterium]